MCLALHSYIEHKCISWTFNNWHPAIGLNLNFSHTLKSRESRCLKAAKKYVSQNSCLNVFLAFRLLKCLHGHWSSCTVSYCILFFKKMYLLSKHTLKKMLGYFQLQVKIRKMGYILTYDGLFQCKILSCFTFNPAFFSTWYLRDFWMVFFLNECLQS